MLSLSKARSRWRLPAALTVSGIICGCHSATVPTEPCPRPAFSLLPATDSVAVGDTIRFAPGPQLALDHGVIGWTSSNPLVAAVDESGLAVAVSRGSAQIGAIDGGSPVSCPDRWYGTLMVR
jgi:hypothetical protein